MASKQPKLTKKQEAFAQGVWLRRQVMWAAVRVGGTGHWG